MDMNQRSLLDALEPINPLTQVTAWPGIDAYCICDRDKGRSCGWPYCAWKEHIDLRPTDSAT